MTLRDFSRVVIDPAWALATWSTCEECSIANTRSTVMELLQIFDDLWETAAYLGPGPLRSADHYRLNAYAFIPIVQMLSLID